MKIILVLSLGLILVACKDKEQNLGDIYSFDEIANARIEDDGSFNGKEILINSKMESSFGLACPAVFYEPCFDPNLPVDQYEHVDEYGHSRDTLELYCGGQIRLITNDNKYSEELVIDYREHTDFFFITADKEINSTILATVEFTEEIDHCDKKTFKGTKITLSSGQHEILLNMFMSGNE